jgi:hypothetical protein
VLEDCRLLPIPRFADDRGALAWVDFDGLPFVPVRAYWLWDWRPSAPRGVHAHRRIQQLYVAVRGGVTVRLDDGKGRRDVRLDHPDQGLLIAPMTWRAIDDPTGDALLLAFASGPHDEAEIVRDHATFLREVGP